MKVAKAEFARIIGKSQTSVDHYVAQGMPGFTKSASRGQKAEIELEQAVPWLIAWTQKALDRARTQLADEQRRKIELEVRRLKRITVMVDYVATTWTRLVGSFRSRMLSIPTKLAGQLVGVSDANVIRDKIEGEVLQALGELSNEGLCRESDEEAPPFGRADGEAAAPADGEPVGGPEPPAFP